MNRSARILALSALIVALAAPMSFAQGNAPSPPSTPNSGSTKGGNGSTKTHGNSTQHRSGRQNTGSKSSTKLDLNTATAGELMKLPGVGQATADKIVAGRPYTSKDQLVSKKILSQKEYSQISSHVVAKSGTSKGSAEEKHESTGGQSSQKSPSPSAQSKSTPGTPTKTTPTSKK
jgi:hypothetical protein